MLDEVASLAPVVIRDCDSFAIRHELVKEMKCR